MSRSVRRAVRGHADPGTALAEVNRSSGWLGADRFATVLLMVLDAARHELSFAGAGHANPWLCGRSGAAIELGKENTGLPLNLLEDLLYDITKAELAPGTMFFAASDALSDKPDPEGERLGPAWFEEAIRAAAASPSALLRAIVDRVSGSTTDEPARFVLNALCLGRTR